MAADGLLSYRTEDRELPAGRYGTGGKEPHRHRRRVLPSVSHVPTPRRGAPRHDARRVPRGVANRAAPVRRPDGTEAAHRGGVSGRPRAYATVSRRLRGESTEVGEVLAEGAPDAVDGLDDDEIAATGELMQKYDLDDMVEADVAELAEELKDSPGF